MSERVPPIRSELLAGKIEKLENPIGSGGFGC